MATVWHVFQGCGFASWACLLAGILALALTTPTIILSLARARAARLLGWCMFAMSSLPIAIGVLGMLNGRSKVDAVLGLAGLSPLQREAIRAEGYEEARGCLLVGGALTLLPLVLSGLALTLAYVLPPRAAAERAGHRPGAPSA